MPFAGAPVATEPAWAASTSSSMSSSHMPTAGPQGWGSLPDAAVPSSHLYPQRATLPRRRSSIIPQIIHGDPTGAGPLRIGAYFRPSKPEHQLMSWEHIRQTVSAGDLDHLSRHPDCEEEYMQWAKEIRAQYGGLERYIAEERIGWSADRIAEECSKGGYFQDEGAATGDAKESSTIRVVFNDWPYAIPLDCKHYVVWCKNQIIDPGLFETDDTPFPKGPVRDAVYRGIITDGTRGVTGTTTHVPKIGFRTTEILREVAASSDGRHFLSNVLGTDGSGSSAELEAFAEAGHTWAGRFVDRFIRRHWSEDLYETAWFCNPPHLRTVPGLSHFHVIVRPKAKKVDGIIK